MIRVDYRILELQKLFPLTISRGTQATSDNLYVTVAYEGIEGIGELSPATASDWTSERGQAQIEKFVAESNLFDSAMPSPHDAWQAMRDAGVDPPAMAALDVAIWDWWAKKAGLPLHAMLGLPMRGVPTSVTIGLNPPDVTRERVPKIIASSGGRCLKIKLGSPEGRDFDKAHFEAAREAAAPFHVKLRVDANGGWTAEEAVSMIGWLSERGVDYVEQPLKEGEEADLPFVFERRKLPIFIDESCRWASDAAAHASYVDGVNLKLMKCGGVTEALRIVATARAHGLKTMIGCMSESSIAIAAGAAMSALFDYIDLDSHTNLNPDPAAGASLVEGVVIPSGTPGHGAWLKAC